MLVENPLLRLPLRLSELLGPGTEKDEEDAAAMVNRYYSTTGDLMLRAEKQNVELPLP